jgi:hypothetical protein
MCKSIQEEEGSLQAQKVAFAMTGAVVVSMVNVV